MILETSIKTDLTRANLFNPIVIAEDDENSHVLIAQLTLGGKILTLRPENRLTASLNYRRADGLCGNVSGTIGDDGSICIPLPDEALALDDIVVCDIMLNHKRTITTHALSVVSGELAVTETTADYDCPLKTALFYIDSQLRVITEYEGGEI